MPTDNQLALASQEPLPVVRPAPTPAEMLDAVLRGGVTEANIAVVEKIMALHERMQEKEAEKAYAVAFVALQADMQVVKAVCAVPNNDGTIRYKFAAFEDIMKEVGPKLKGHGFTVTFSTDFAEGRLIKLCTLQHVGGHSKTNKFAVRIGAGPPKATECQADGAASTYAKRFALCDALNIQIDHDTDARAEGDAVTPDQAFELERRVAEINANKEAFLKFAGSKTFSEIPSANYRILDEFLRHKEGKRK